MTSISVKSVGKAYKQYPTRFSRLKEWLWPVKERHSLKWVLQDINFEVFPGEAVGIIGINGAGKSTLLKIITGTTLPTVGAINMHGRVAALLELGMGFHPDFTGRQNVYMSGQLLGMTNQEIVDLMPAIEEFAEIGDYIDQPVRIYSSGMQVRLAFSIATAIRPDILIVDEALSVGDAYFQHKSFARIKEFNALGTTLLIVSHDKQSIISLCNRAILLADGTKKMEGDPEAVMDYYNAMLADKQNQQITQIVLDTGKTKTISGTGEITVQEIYLLDENDNVVDTVNVGQTVTLKVIAKANEKLDKLVFGYSIKDRVGQVMYGTNTELEKQVIYDIKANQEIVYLCKFNMNLGVGSYSIQTALVSSDTHLDNNYEWVDLAFVFNVVNINKPYFAGCAWLHPKIEILQ